MFRVSWTSSAVPRMPSGPAWFWSSRHGHEVGLAARDEERVIGLQRHDDGAAAALRHQVETVVEELAEEHEHQIERRGEAEVGRDVRDEERPGNRDPAASGPEQTKPPEPHGFAAAAAAAGLAADWSTIRLLMMRGWESMTLVSVFVA